MASISSISEVIKGKKGFQRKKDETLLSTHNLVKPKADMSSPEEREKAMRKAEKIKAENDKQPVGDETINESTEDEKDDLSDETENEEK